MVILSICRSFQTSKHNIKLVACIEHVDALLLLMIETGATELKL